MKCDECGASPTPEGLKQLKEKEKMRLRFRPGHWEYHHRQGGHDIIWVFEPVEVVKA